MHRPYDLVSQKLRQQIQPADGRQTRMSRTIDTLWELLHPHDVSWIGFYLHEAEPELTLGPRRNKPACSPIGLHGACGRAFTSGSALVIGDVRSLGESYIACDPRDLAEVVVPCFEADGRCWGVLDADSYSPNAFTLDDALRLAELLRQVGLSARDLSAPDVRLI